MISDGIGSFPIVFASENDGVDFDNEDDAAADEATAAADACAIRFSNLFCRSKVDEVVVAGLFALNTAPLTIREIELLSTSAVDDNSVGLLKLFEVVCAKFKVAEEGRLLIASGPGGMV